MFRPVGQVESNTLATLWGSNIRLWAWLAGARGGSCCNLILTGGPAEDGSAADLMVGQVDRRWGWFRPGLVRVARVSGVAVRW